MQKSPEALVQKHFQRLAKNFDEAMKDELTVMAGLGHLVHSLLVDDQAVTLEILLAKCQAKVNQLGEKERRELNPDWYRYQHLLALLQNIAQQRQK